MPNLLAITLDLHIEIALSVPVLTSGAVHRASANSKLPVGVGISVARLIRQLGHQAEIGSFVGGFNGRFAVYQFEAESLQGHYVWCEDDTPSHIQIKELDSPDKRTTALSGQGILISEEQVAQFADLIRQNHARFEWVCFSGAASPEFRAGAYTLLIEAARPAKIAVYSHGAALAEFARQSPDLLYLDAAEASSLLDYRIDSPDTAKRGCLDLHRRGIERVVIALSNGDIVGYEWETCLHLPAPPVKAINLDATNNAYFAGMLAALMDNQPLFVALRQGAAAMGRVQFSG
ncbi:MAG: PfkB family carbohydrate kinase [Chloroflexota bacterium]